MQQQLGQRAQQQRMRSSEDEKKKKKEKEKEEEEKEEDQMDEVREPPTEVLENNWLVTVGRKA